MGLEQGLFTNAYVEVPLMFKWIRISLTNNGFKFIKKPKGYFGVCMNLLTDTKEEKLIEWCLKSRDLGASYFQVRPALSQKQPILTPPVYLKDFETPEFKIFLTAYKFRESIVPKDYDRCYGYNFCPSIDWNGRVGVCLYRMNEEKYVFGDLNKKSFSEIWANKEVFYPVTKDCQNCCKNHRINQILFTAKQTGHINFP